MLQKAQGRGCPLGCRISKTVLSKCNKSCTCHLLLLSYASVTNDYDGFLLQQLNISLAVSDAQATAKS